MWSFDMHFLELVNIHDTHLKQHFTEPSPLIFIIVSESFLTS